MTANPRLILAGALTVVLPAAGATYALANRETEAPAQVGPAPAMTVTSTVPGPVQWPNSFEASGVIAPWQEAIIGTQIGGYRLIDVRANVGDQVKKGQVLAVIDADLLRADLARLEAAWEEAEADRNRALKLKSTGALSEQEVLQLLTRAKTSAAALEAKRLELRYTNIVAPDDGVIRLAFRDSGRCHASGPGTVPPHPSESTRMAWGTHRRATRTHPNRPSHSIESPRREHRARHGAPDCARTRSSVSPWHRVRRSRRRRPRASRNVCERQRNAR